MGLTQNLLREIISHPNFRRHIISEILHRAGLYALALPGLEPLRAGLRRRAIKAGRPVPRAVGVWFENSDDKRNGGRWYPAGRTYRRPAAYGIAVQMQPGSDGTPEPHILMMRDTISHVWWFSGGAVEPGELTTDALVREYREETGLLITVGPLIDFQEDFVLGLGLVPTHRMMFFYYVDVTGGDILTNGNDFDSDGAAWRPLSEIARSRFAERQRILCEKGLAIWRTRHL